MNSAHQLHSLRTRLLAPLIFLLLTFVVLFGYLAWSFLVNYSLFSRQIALHSRVGRNAMEIIRTRAASQEALLMYRLQGDPSGVAEIKFLERTRMANIKEIQAAAESEPELRSLSPSLVAGLSEISYLRQIMIDAMGAGNHYRADRAFQQLSLIFEINSARLKDFSLKNEYELLRYEHELQNVVTAANWGFAFAIMLMALTIWLIAAFYRKSVLSPMQRLHRGLQSLSEGNLKSRITINSAPRELYEMMDDFNHMAQSLEASQDQVTAALQLRDEFLSIASHELKTPLTSLKLQAQIYSRKIALGKERMTDAQFKKFSDLIDTQVKRLTGLVEEMLDISRLRSGKLEPKKERIDLAEITQAVCIEFGQELGLAGRNLDCRLKSVTGFWDKLRLEQVIINLISNAMKYGGGKPIHVAVFPKGQSAFLSVRDEGMGIAKEHHDRIFERFERAGTALPIQGLGLGLYISKQIISAHHGKIHVESEPGQGATFTVELPTC